MDSRQAAARSSGDSETHCLSGAGCTAGGTKRILERGEKHTWVNGAERAGFYVAIEREGEQGPI